MILPFVREIFAELEQTPGFDRVRRHLSLGAGRRRVSGLTATARALYLPLMARAAKQLVVVIVADNKAAEALEPLLKAGCELTGALDPARVVRFPAHDVLPFENLSPHPDVQEQRAAALWKLATGGVDLLIAPVESAALKLFDLDYYAGLAVTLKRGEEVDIEVLTTPRWTSSKCPASSPDAAAFSTSTRPRSIAPSVSSSSATRSRPFANSIPKPSAPNPASTKRNCCP
jgi:transcription-repair coupling factor (superfamily II helicase)